MTTLERQGTTVSVGGTGGPVTLTVCRPGIVRVTLPGPGEPPASFVEPRDWPATTLDLIEGAPARLVTPALQVEIATAPPRLSFAGPDGAWLLREAADGAGRARVRFTFSGEQHFYGLGQGGG